MSAGLKRPIASGRGVQFWVLVLVGVLFSVALASLSAGPAFAGKEIILRVGEEKTIYLGRIRNVSVGASDVIEVTKHPDGDKIIVFGLKEGYSSLTVGTVSYDVSVVGGIEQLRRDVENLLADIPGVEVLTSGTKVVMDGVVKRRDDLARVQAIAENNKGLIYSLVLLDERDIVRKAQIQLHFQVLEINRNRDHDLGIDWSSGPVRVVLDTISYVQFGIGPIQDAAGTAGGALSRSPDDMINLDSSVDIRRVLDKDFFTTISGSEVTFQRGKSLIFSTTSNLTGNVTFMERDIGLLVSA